MHIQGQKVTGDMSYTLLERTRGIILNLQPFGFEDILEDVTTANPLPAESA